MSEELLALFVAEALQAVGALKLPLAAPGCFGAPALSRGSQTLGPSPRPLASRRQWLYGISL